MKITKTATLEVSNQTVSLDYDFIESFLIENSEDAANKYKIIFEHIEIETERITKLGFNDAEVKIHGDVEGYYGYDFKIQVFITYDKGRNKRGVYLLKDLGWQTIDAFNYLSKIFMFSPFHIKRTTATKQKLDNLDSYKAHIDKAKAAANEMSRVKNIETENITLKSTITALEEKIKELTK